MGSAKQLPTYMKSVRKLYHENTALYKQVKSIYLGQPVAAEGNNTLEKCIPYKGNGFGNKKARDPILKPRSKSRSSRSKSYANTVHSGVSSEKNICNTRARGCFSALNRCTLIKNS